MQVWVYCQVCSQSWHEPLHLPVTGVFFAAAFLAPFAVRLSKRKIWPKMTVSIFSKIMALALLEPVVDMNLHYIGLKYTTATFTKALGNLVPAITFILAWILRLEKVKMRKLHSQAKILGTTATIGGAMIMTLANTLKSYPTGLSLSCLICTVGALQASVVALVAERGNPATWALHWDIKLLAALGAGVIVIGLYMVLWGKNQDHQDSQESIHDQVASIDKPPSTLIKFPTKQERIDTPKQLPEMKQCG
nr:WAT1-related protein At2g39510-like [Ipomoea batatas]